MQTAHSDGIDDHRLPAALVLVSRGLGAVCTLALWLAGAGLVLMTAFVAWQVWGRYVLNASPTWTEPAAILLMGWFIFLGAAVGVREGYHLGFEVVLAIATPRAAFAMRCLSDVVTGGFGAAMAWYGMTLTLGTWTATLPSLGLPGGFDYMPIVGGGVLIALFSLERLIRRFAIGPGRENVSWNS